MNSYKKLKKKKKNKQEKHKEFHTKTQHNQTGGNQRQRILKSVRQATPYVHEGHNKTNN